MVTSIGGGLGALHLLPALPRFCPNYKQVDRGHFLLGLCRRASKAPGPSTAKSALRRQLLEESRVAVQVEADDEETLWALVAYSTFEVGALPILLRAAFEQPSSGRQSEEVDSRLCVRQLMRWRFGKAESSVVGGLEQWHALADWVEQCDPAFR
jgi:hypothetical protein